MRRKIVGIVASAGGPQVIAAILGGLPGNLNVPIVVVQHMSAGFIDNLVDLLANSTDLEVKLAENGEALAPGIVYVAPAEVHTEISSLDRIVLKDGPPVDGHKPSGTVLLRSMAKSYGKGALGIVLSGMGRDGAAGLKLIHEEGGHTIGQDVGDGLIDGMPRAAVDLDAVDEILPSSEIPGSIIRWAGE